MNRLWIASRRSVAGQVALAMFVLLAPILGVIFAVAFLSIKLNARALTIAIPTAFVAGVLVLAAGLGLSDRRERLALAVYESEFGEWAAARGWEGRWAHDGGLPAGGYPFQQLGKHSVLRARSGEVHGREAVHMHYRIAREYESGRGTVTTFHDFTITAVVVNADFPVISVTPQRRLDGLKAVMGYQDIDLESVAFNKRWRVTGHSARAAHQVLHPLVMARLLEPGADRDRISWDSNVIMIIQQDFDIRLDRLDERLELLSDLAERVGGYMARPGVARDDAAARRFADLQQPRETFSGLQLRLVLAGGAVGFVGMLAAVLVIRLGHSSLWGAWLFAASIAAGGVLWVASDVAKRNADKRARREWIEHANKSIGKSSRAKKKN